MMINPQMFREYDIRGIVDDDLTNDSVYLIGKGFGTYAKRNGNQSVAIGGDARLSTPRFKEAFIKGLMETGCDVIDVGICATPVLYFAIWKLNTKAGAMITASHNPPEYNGIKLNFGLRSVYAGQIQDVLHIIQQKDFEKGEGTLEYYSTIIEEYKTYIVENIHLARPVSCIVDAGNGAGGPILPDILRRLGCNVKELYCEMDGTFPNHHPDPTIEKNLKDMMAAIPNSEYEIGLGLDGDADRIGVVDEKGHMLYGDQILNIYARDFLDKNPGEVVLADVKCSKNLFDDIEKHGGKPIMYKTGHANIKNKMKEDGVRMGGEMSGHIFFADRFLGFDDAMYASCRFVEILSHSQLKCSELLADQPVLYHTPEMRVDCDDNIKFELVEKVKNSFVQEGQKVIDVDGMRILFPDGWGLVRASNTQPILVLRFEATTEARMKEIQELVENRIKQFN